MAYDAALEQRIDVLVDTWQGLAKRKMFGGIGYVIGGNMAFGIWKSALVVRCGPERQFECLRERHTSRFDVTGRPMKGWLLVEAGGFSSEAALRRWLTLGYAFASSLPPKPEREFVPVDAELSAPAVNMASANSNQQKET